MGMQFLDKVVVVPVQFIVGRRLPLMAMRQIPRVHFLDDLGDSTVAVHMVVDVPVLQLQRVPQVMDQTVEKTVWKLPRCSSAWWRDDLRWGFSALHTGTGPP